MNLNDNIKKILVTQSCVAGHRGTVRGNGDCGAFISDTE